jgi:hypothetical protein
VNRLLIGTFSATISASSLTTLSVMVPISIPLGTYDLTLESNSGRYVKVQALTVKAISSQSGLIGKTFALPKFSGAKTALNSLQRQFVSRLLQDSGVSKVVCTGLIRPGMTHHARVQVRLRAKAACNQVRVLLPTSSVWVQSKSTTAKQVVGRVILTIRG